MHVVFFFVLTLSSLAAILNQWALVMSALEEYSVILTTSFYGMNQKI